MVSCIWPFRQDAHSMGALASERSRIQESFPSRRRDHAPIVARTWQSLANSFGGDLRGLSRGLDPRVRRLVQGSSAFISGLSYGLRMRPRSHAQRFSRNRYDLARIGPVHNAHAPVGILLYCVGVRHSLGHLCGSRALFRAIMLCAPVSPIGLGPWVLSRSRGSATKRVTHRVDAMRRLWVLWHGVRCGVVWLASPLIVASLL